MQRGQTASRVISVRPLAFLLNVSSTIDRTIHPPEAPSGSRQCHRAHRLWWGLGRDRLRAYDTNVPPVPLGPPVCRRRVGPEHALPVAS